jgi:adenylosuccinate lyase
MEIPHGKRDIITAAGTTFGFDAAVFLKCEEIRRKTDRFSSAEVRVVFRGYLKEVGRLCELIEQMDLQS